MRKIDLLLLGRPPAALQTLALDVGGAVTAALSHRSPRTPASAVLSPELVPVARPVGSGGLAVTLHRDTVLADMALCSGMPIADPGAPITSTERRMSERLVQRLAEGVERLLTRALLEPSAAEPGAPEDTGATGQGMHWEWRAEVALGSTPPRPLVISLDAHWSQALDRFLSAQRTRGRQRPGTASASALLQVDMCARLLEIHMSAAELHSLRPDMVIPVRLDRTVALVNGEPLLKASVAEHLGKLHLTNFETLE
jgi:hypothetical protein